MKTTTKIISFTFLLFIGTGAIAQSNSTYEPKEVYSLENGVTMYEKFNQRSTSSELRLNDKGKPISGFVMDKYSHGCVLHEGYYQKGKLLFYTNYHPNGKVERVFKIIDTKKSKLKIYYRNGKLKSEIVYSDNAAIKWTDFFQNGQIAFYEEFEKELQYHISRIYYFENGNVESSLKLKDKRRLIFACESYFDTGGIKSKSRVIFNQSKQDYVLLGKVDWYRKDGTKILENDYENTLMFNQTELR